MKKEKFEEFLKIAKEKREVIMEKLAFAFCESIDNKHLQFHVELYLDGTVEVWHQIAGGNNYTMSSYNDESIQIGMFNNQYTDVDSDSTEYDEVLTPEQRNEMEKEGYTNAWEYLSEHNLRDQISKAEDNYFEWYKDNYKYEEAQTKYDLFIENMDNCML